MSGDSLIAGGLRREILEGDLACCLVYSEQGAYKQRCINLSTSTKVVSKAKQVVWVTGSGNVVRAPFRGPMYVMSDEDAIKWFINQKAPGGGDLLHKAPYDLMRKALLQ